MKHAMLMIGLVGMLVLPARGQEKARDWYELHEQANGAQVVVYCWAGGERRKAVNADKAAFAAWLAKGNTAKVVAYKPPTPVIDTRPVEVRRQEAIAAAVPVEMVVEALVRAATGDSKALDQVKQQRAAAAAAFDASINVEEPAQ